MSARRWLRRVRHPVVSARRLVRRVAEGADSRWAAPPGVDGGSARFSRLPTERSSWGPAGIVRQALPGVPLDVVGTDPHRLDVTVVSAADEDGSLPRRWACVVLTDPAPWPGRLLAVAGACLPGGVLAVVRPAALAPVSLPGAQVERTLVRGAVEVVLATVRT